jgi:CDP-4-dehydro-6-deoxyglucose reductase, E3
VRGRIETILAEKKRLASGVFDLRLAVTSPGELDFRAGQFVTLQVPVAATLASVRRSYSIASPTFCSREVRLIARHIPGGHASEYFMRLAPGDSVPMAGPFGAFTLAESHPGDLVFGTTGTGIATIMPMLEELVRMPARAPGKRLVYWGLRRPEDIFARDELEDLCRRAGAELCIHLSAATPAWPGRHGRIIPSVLALLPMLEAPVFYLVGNGAMVAEMKASLVEQGVDRKHQIRTESFFG